MQKSSELDDLLTSAEGLLPKLAARAVEANSMARLTPQTISEFKATGMFRTQQPARYGGYQLDFGAMVEVSAKLAEACASSAWLASVIASHHWILGMFPAEAQDDVWATNINAIVCSAYASSNASVTSEKGGYRLSGTWHYASGVNYADWVILLASVDEGRPKPRMTTLLVPRDQFEVMETWNAVGLKATGTHDLTVSGTFVPIHRELGFEEANQGNAPGASHNKSHIYRLPLMGVGSFTVVGPCFGVARGALHDYISSVSKRSGVVSGVKLVEQTPLQLKVAKAAAEIDAAWSLINTDLREVNDATRKGGSLTGEQCARFKRDVAFSAQLCRRSVDRLVMAMGVPGQKAGDPVQARALDMNALASHGLTSWEPNALSFGRVALGLDSEGHYF